MLLRIAPARPEGPNPGSRSPVLPEGGWRTGRGLALCGALLLAVSGCGGGEGRGPGDVVVDTLAGGVVQITSGKEGAWGGSPAWTLEAELSLGSADTEGPEMFGQVAALEVDDEGRILVLDAQAAELRIFGPDGAHLRTVGGRGSGPGEFRTAVGLGVAPDGHLWVVDSGNGRYTLFTPEGDLVRTLPREIGYMAWPWPTGFDAGGRLHDVIASDAIAEVSENGVVGRSFPVPTAEVEQIRVRNAQGVMVLSSVAPFRPRMHWRFDGRGYIWSAMSDRMRFVQQTLAGDTVRIVQRAHDPVLVARIEADSAETFIRETLLRSGGAGAVMEGSFASPPEKPAFETFHVDHEGRLWVEPTRAHGASRAMQLFGADGAYLGELPIAEGLELLAVKPVFRPGTMTALVVNEAGVPTVVRYRIPPEW